MKSISITIPMEPAALDAAAKMFSGLAEKLEREEIARMPVMTDKEQMTVARVINENKAAAVTTDDPLYNPDPSLKAVADDFAKGGMIIPAPGAPPVTVPGPEIFAAPPIVLAPPPAAPPAPGVEVDSDGLPWDARIHASSKAKVAGGKWRNRRNLDPALLATVTAELKGVMAAPAAPTVPAAPAPAASVAPAAPAPAPAAPLPPVAPAAPPPPPPADGPLTWPAFLAKVTKAGLTREVCTAAAVKHGLPSFTNIAIRPDLIPAIAAELGL